MPSVKKCKNCGSENPGNFCQECGQRLSLTKINFWFVIRDFFGTVFNVDAPFPKTMLQLLKNPGEMITAFLTGNRKRYYAPIRYLLLCLFINLLIGEIVGFDPIENQKAMDSRPTVTADSTNTGYLIGQFLADYLNYFLLLFPFTIGLISKLFYWKLPFNYAERVVFGFFIASQYILVSLIPICLSMLNPYLFLIHYPLSILYLTYASYSFHARGNRFVGVLKSLVMAILYLLSYFAIATIFAFLILRIQGKL